MTVTAEYIGSTVYVSAGNIHVSGTGSEIKDLVAWAGRLAGANDAAAAGNAYAQFFFPRAHAAVRRGQHPGSCVVG